MKQNDVWMIKRMIVFLLILSILLPMILLGGNQKAYAYDKTIAFTKDELGAHSGQILYTDGTIQVLGEDRTWMELSHLSTNPVNVSPYSYFRIVYHYSVDDLDELVKEMNQNGIESVKYEVPIPDNLLTEVMVTTKVTIKMNDTNIDIGKLYYEQNQAYIQFDLEQIQSLIQEGFDKIRDGEITLQASLEEKSVHAGTYIIQVLNETYYLEVKEDNVIQGEEPEIYKSGVYSDGVLQWNVVVKDGYPTYNKVTIKEQLPTGTSLMGPLFMETVVVDRVTDEIVSREGTEIVTAMGNQFEIPVEFSSEIYERYPVYRYQIQRIITIKSFIEDDYVWNHMNQKVNFTNHVNLYGTNPQNKEAVEKTAKYTVDVGINQFIEKKGKILDFDTYQWTITVDCNNRFFKNLTLYDKIQDGQTLDVSSIRINDQLLCDTKYKLTQGDKKDPYSFAIQLGKGGAYGENVYEITYETDRDQSYYDDYQWGDDVILKNETWLDYNWISYPGEDDTVQIHHLIPAVNKEIQLSAGLIIQEALASNPYNPATSTMGWKTKVNPYQIQVDHSVDIRIRCLPGHQFVCDDINKDGVYDSYEIQKALAFEDKSQLEQIDSVSLGEDENGQYIDIKLKNIDQQTVVLTYQTQGRIHKNIAGNGETTYKTQGQILRNVNGLNEVLVSSEATQKGRSDVLRKVGLGYSYNSTKNERLVQWKVTVNTNKMKMNQIVLTDEIQSNQQLFLDNGLGLQIINGDKMMIPNSEDPTVIPRYTYNSASKQLTLHLGDLLDGKKGVITYHTTVDEEVFLTGGKLYLTNNITLHNNYKIDKGVMVIGVQKIDNEVLKKVSKVVDGKPYIDYQVQVNPNGAKFNGILILMDTLQRGLRFDPDSITIYEAENIDGKVNKSNHKIGIDKQEITLREGRETLQLTLDFTNYPSNATFLLEYRVWVCQLEPFYKNEITILHNGTMIYSTENITKHAFGEAMVIGFADKDKLIPTTPSSLPTTTPTITPSITAEPSPMETPIPSGLVETPTTGDVNMIDTYLLICNFSVIIFISSLIYLKKNKKQLDK